MEEVSCLSPLLSPHGKQRSSSSASVTPDSRAVAGLMVGDALPHPLWVVVGEVILRRLAGE